MAKIWRPGLTFEKDPGATKPYPFDVSEWLDTGDTLVADPGGHSIAADSGITIDSSSNTDAVVTPVISGGTHGTTYNIEFTFTTVDGVIEVKTIRIKVKNQ